MRPAHLAPAVKSWGSTSAIVRNGLKIKSLQNRLPIAADTALLISKPYHNLASLPQRLLQHRKVFLHNGKVGRAVCRIL